MDAHYHQVMKAREAIVETEPKLYFAYSGVLDREVFELWRDQHSYQFFDLPEGQVGFAEDMDLVFDFPSRWWGGRVAGLSSVKSSKVWGRLYEIDPKNWPVVQHKEGLISGACIEVSVKVHVNGQIVDAIAFTTAPHKQSLQGQVSGRYVEALMRGAQRSGLPQDYIQSLSERAR